VTGTTGTTGSTYESTTPGKRDEAANLAQEAGEAGKRVAGTAKEETKAVGSEARYQARRLADQVGSEVRQQAAHQQSRAAQGLRSIGDEFSSMANGTGTGSGFAADIARQAGDRVGAAAQWLDERDPRALLEEVKGFARRRPGVFIGIAVTAGVVVGRLVRALAQPSDDGSDSRAYGSYGNGNGRRVVGSGTSYGTTGTTTGTGYTTGTTGTGYTTGTTGTGYGTGTTGTGYGAGTSGTAIDADPLAGETWTEGGATTSRDGL